MFFPGYLAATFVHAGIGRSGILMSPFWWLPVAVVLMGGITLVEPKVQASAAWQKVRKYWFTVPLFITMVPPVVIGGFWPVVLQPQVSGQWSPAVALALIIVPIAIIMIRGRVLSAVQKHRQ